MRDIEKARIIRAAILGSTTDVEWGSTVFEDVEHRCWHVRGCGWRATVSNLLDVMDADGRRVRPCRHDHFELRQQSIMEVFNDAEQPILGLSYGTEADEDVLFRFHAEDCDRIFKHDLAMERLEAARRRPSSTILYPTAHAN